MALRPSIIGGPSFQTLTHNMKLAFVLPLLFCLASQAQQEFRGLSINGMWIPETPTNDNAITYIIHSPEVIEIMSKMRVVGDSVTIDTTTGYAVRKGAIKSSSDTKYVIESMFRFTSTDTVLSQWQLKIVEVINDYSNNTGQILEIRIKGAKKSQIYRRAFRYTHDTFITVDSLLLRSATSFTVPQQ